MTRDLDKRIQGDTNHRYVNSTGPNCGPRRLTMSQVRWDRYCTVKMGRNVDRAGDGWAAKSLKKAPQHPRSLLMYLHALGE